MNTFTLSNGIEIPSVGIGTFLLTPDQAENSVKTALACGYRLIDTANAYVNEKAVGRGMKESKLDRKEIFLSTKLWPTVYEDPQAIEKTLARLDTDYIDLLFLHQPTSNFMAGYRQLEKAYKQGTIRAIGISNFSGDNLDALLKQAEIMPQVIQIEAHPYFTQAETMAKLAFCKTRLMAWYPLGHGDKKLINEPLFQTLGAKYHKSSAQIILRWHTQMGFIVIPGSANPQHIQDNIDIFDFTLTEAEMKQIESLNKGIRYYNSTPQQVEQYAHYYPAIDEQK